MLIEQRFGYVPRRLAIQNIGRFLNVPTKCFLINIFFFLPSLSFTNICLLETLQLCSILIPFLEVCGKLEHLGTCYMLRSCLATGTVNDSHRQVHNEKFKVSSHILVQVPAPWNFGLH